jgi:hypothetical protein
MKNMSISNPYEMLFSRYKVIYILFPVLNSQDLLAKCMPMNSSNLEKATHPPPLPQLFANYRNPSFIFRA